MFSHNTHEQSNKLITGKNIYKYTTSLHPRYLLDITKVRNKKYKYIFYSAVVRGVWRGGYKLLHSTAQLELCYKC